MPNSKLSPADREFFSTVSRIVFTNPFTDARATLDAEVGGGSADDEHGARALRVTERVSARLATLDSPRIDAYQGKDRDVLLYTFLFEVYHHFKDPFDALIEEQVRAGPESIPVPFANNLLDRLHGYGFPKQEALRSMGLFFQIRRAFFFIERLIGESRCMKQLRRDLWNNIFTSDIQWYNLYLWSRMEDFSTLLLGETGTGKGTAATAIGRSGFIPFDAKRGCFKESFTRSFVQLNLSQFPEALIESELFGHRKGSFTGAVEDHLGALSTCSTHGSIFLDEIGEVSVPVQIKLLQVLQERHFTPVGSHEKQRFNGRVIAATNRTIEELRGEKLLRDDFFYRLCSDIIVVPPLHQRIAEDPGELIALVDLTLRRTIGSEAPDLLDLVISTIKSEIEIDYPWPGNVRELEQCVRRILIKRRYEGDFASRSTDARGDLVREVDQGCMTAARIIECYCALLYDRHGSYEKVAKITDLDRRTVKKYILRRRGEGEE